MFDKYCEGDWYEVTYFTESGYIAYSTGVIARSGYEAEAIAGHDIGNTWPVSTCEKRGTQLEAWEAKKDLVPGFIWLANSVEDYPEWEVDGKLSLIAASVAGLRFGKTARDPLR